MDNDLQQLAKKQLAENPLTAEVQRPGDPHRFRKSQLETTQFLATSSVTWMASAGCFITPSGAFGNQVAKNYAAELAAAKKVQAPLVRIGDEAFEQVVNMGTVKFVITEKGELIIAPYSVNGVEISHAVLAGGNPVLAAGEAEIAGTASQFIGLSIRPHSGHYLNGATAEQSNACIALAREAFKKLGVVFPDL